MAAIIAEARQSPRLNLFNPYRIGDSDLSCINSAPLPEGAMPESKDLRNMGLKATLPRLKVLDLFQHSKQRHMTAEDVYKLLLEENADIGLATVYRVLTQFEQAGLLVRHHFESGKAVFELNEGSHHDHLVCLQCGRVEEFFDAEIERRQSKIAKDRGFNIHDHSLYLYADCTKDRCPHKPS
jgi:Fur family transcriptional regulator, ferric uptake regulator